MRPQLIRLLIVAIALGTLSPQLALARNENTNHYSFDYNILSCSPGHQSDLQRLLDLWRVQCREWKHCAGAKCRFDITGGLDKKSFQEFVIDINSKVGPLLPEVKPVVENELSILEPNHQIVTEHRAMNSMRWELDKAQLNEAVSRTFPDIKSIISDEALKQMIRSKKRSILYSAERRGTPTTFKIDYGPANLSSFSYGFPVADFPGGDRFDYMRKKITPVAGDNGPYPADFHSWPGRFPSAAPVGDFDPPNW